VTPIVLASIAVVAIFFFLVRTRTRKPSAAEEHSNWSMYHWNDESGLRILQTRDELPNDARKNFDVGVVIEWKYEAEGVPDEPTMKHIYELEDAIRPIRDDQSAIHVHTITGNGIREWCYYTADYPKFEAQFNKLVAGMPRMPIELSHQVDPGWSYWKKLKAMASSGVA